MKSKSEIEGNDIKNPVCYYFDDIDKYKLYNIDK